MEQNPTGKLISDEQAVSQGFKPNFQGTFADAGSKAHTWHSPKAQAAIALKVPCSGIPELDEMIRESRRLDMAKAAMQFMGAPCDSKRAFQFADALLAASGKEQMK